MLHSQLPAEAEAEGSRRLGKYQNHNNRMYNCTTMFTLCFNEEITVQIAADCKGSELEESRC